MRIAIAMTLLLLPAAADQIVLTGGGKLSGEIEREDAESVTLRMLAGSMTVSRDRIDRIVREHRETYLRREGKSRLSDGSTAAAVELYERAARLDPSDLEALADALVAHARLSLERFRLDRARVAVARLTEVAPDHADLPALETRIRGEEAKAKRLWDEAQRHFRAGRFSSGIEAMNAWKLRQPAGDAGAMRQLALAHESAGAHAVEKAQLRSALDHFRAARSYGARGDVIRALALLKPVAALEALREGREEEARRMIASLAIGYPTPGVARFLQAVQDQLRGEMEQAVAGYSEAERLARAAQGRRSGLSYDLVAAYARATLRQAITKPPQQGARRWSEVYLTPLRESRVGSVTAHAPSDELAERAAREGDEQLRRVAAELGLIIPAKFRAQIVIHANREVYLAADRNPGGTPLGTLKVTRARTSGVTYQTLDAEGRSMIRVESFTGQPTLMTTIMPHEMVHVAQHLGFKAFRRAHWLDEGMAMLNEAQSGREQRVAWLQRSKQLYALTELVSLRSTPPDQAFLYYNQSYAFTAYLRDLGTSGDWRAFLDRLATKNFEQSMTETYGIESVDELERGFLAAYGLRR